MHFNSPGDLLGMKMGQKPIFLLFYLKKSNCSDYGQPISYFLAGKKKSFFKTIIIILNVFGVKVGTF